MSVPFGTSRRHGEFCTEDSEVLVAVNDGLVVDSLVVGVSVLVIVWVVVAILVLEPE